MLLPMVRRAHHESLSCIEGDYLYQNCSKRRMSFENFPCCPTIQSLSWSNQISKQFCRRSKLSSRPGELGARDFRIRPCQMRNVIAMAIMFTERQPNRASQDAKFENFQDTWSTDISQFPLQRFACLNHGHLTRRVVWVMIT